MRRREEVEAGRARALHQLGESTDARVKQAVPSASVTCAMADSVIEEGREEGSTLPQNPIIFKPQTPEHASIRIRIEWTASLGCRKNSSNIAARRKENQANREKKEIYDGGNDQRSEQNFMRQSS